MVVVPSVNVTLISSCPDRFTIIPEPFLSDLFRDWEKCKVLPAGLGNTAPLSAVGEDIPVG